MMTQPDPVLMTLVGGYTLAAATLDYRTQKIPNYLTVSAAVLGLLYHVIAPIIRGGSPIAGLQFAILGLLVGFALLLLPFLLGGGGAGDVKMLAGLGAWLGPWWVMIALAMGAVLGCVMSLMVLTYAATSIGIGATKRQYNIAGAGVADGRPRKIRRALPFVVPIAISTWLVMGYWILKYAMHAS
jgi:prepilin peptidase CpaA